MWLDLGFQYWDVLVVLFTNVMGGRGGEGGGREIDNGVAADRYRLEYRKVDYRVLVCPPSPPPLPNCSTSIMSQTNAKKDIFVISTFN